MRIKNLHLSTRFIIIFLSLLCSFTKRVSSIQDITDKLRDNESLFFSIVFLLLRKLVDLFYFFLFFWINVRIIM